MQRSRPFPRRPAPGLTPSPAVPTAALAAASWAVRRGLRSRLLAALVRPLADDERRAAYWQQHIRIGVLLSEIAAWAVLGYGLLSSGPASGDPVVLGLAALVVVATPLLLLLPLARMVRDVRGPLLFYAWSVLDIVVICVAARRDGGESSPLSVLLFLTLTYMAMAYPVVGVAAMGAFMTVAYLLVVCTPGIGFAAGFVAIVLLAFTTTCVLGSYNSWEAYDQAVLLLRTQEHLAATDSLTGSLNRRAFLDRLRTVTAAAGPDVRHVVCLVDLDGFKAVNDTAGHAAGDALLVAVAVELGRCLRETDTVARLGGDEFAVLATAVDPSLDLAVAERVRVAVALAGAASCVTASVGVTAVRPGDDAHQVLRRADLAMYEAKARGGDGTRVLTG